MDVHFIWVLLLQTMLQWKCIIHVCIHMCNYRKDGICKIKSWKWNYSQQVPIFTVTNNGISMPVSPPTFTKFFFEWKEAGQRATLSPLSLPAPLTSHMTLLLPENSIPEFPTQRSEFKTEWMSEPPESWGRLILVQESWLHISSQFCVQRHRVGSLKLVVVEAFIPQKWADATSEGFSPPLPRDLCQTY